MRANRDAVLAGDYDLAEFPETAPTCGVVAGSDVAELDISAWQSNLACLLPDGNGRIVRAGSAITIGIQWDESRGEEDPEIFEMTTSL
jgi:hypothetical protein